MSLNNFRDYSPKETGERRNHHTDPIHPKVENSYLRKILRYNNPSLFILISFCFVIFCWIYFISKSRKDIREDSLLIVPIEYNEPEKTLKKIDLQQKPSEAIIQKSIQPQENPPKPTLPPLQPAIQKKSEQQVIHKKKETHSVTGILLHFKRRNGVKKVLQIMFTYPFVTGVVVWNNNPEVVLDHSMLVDTNLSAEKQAEHLILYKEKVLIHNSDKNLKDKAKYLACSLANTTACFYSDDDWDISRYARTLYADFNIEPGVMHSVTEPYTYYTNLIWSFFDKSIDLHTGFAWIGCGSMFTKELALSHLKKIDTFLESNEELKNLIPLSDVFFSIWLNNPPSQIVADIVELHLERENVAFSGQSGFLELQHKSSVTAIKILHDELRKNSTLSLFTKKEIENPFPLYLKAPSRNDNYMVYSDLYPFQLRDVSFDISDPKQAIRSTRQNLPSGAHVDQFCYNSMTRTVDKDLSTCWRANRPTGKGSFYALDLHIVRSDIEVKINFGHSTEFQQSLKIRCSNDLNIWNELDIESKFEPGNIVNYKFVEPFRFVEFYSPVESEQKFVVCELNVFQNATMI